MSKNEVVQNEEIVSVETSGTETPEIKVEIRADLNKIVKMARFEEVKSKFGVRHPYFVTFFNGEKVEFVDTDGLYDLIMSYKKCGMNDFLSSKALVEEPKLNDEGVVVGTYICMRYVFADGSIYRLFTKNYSANKIIENYYAFYKRQQIEAKNV